MAAIVTVIFVTVVAWWKWACRVSCSHPSRQSDTPPIDLNSAALGIGRHVSGIADPFNGHIDAFRIAHPALRRLDRDHLEQYERPGAFAAAGTEEQQGGEPPAIGGAGVVVCLMA
jgi:hypothetical protein